MWVLGIKSGTSAENRGLLAAKSLPEPKSFHFYLFLSSMCFCVDILVMALGITLHLCKITCT